MSLPDASMDSCYCQAETPGSTSINASVAGYCGFFNRPVRGYDREVGYARVRGHDESGCFQVSKNVFSTACYCS